MIWQEEETATPHEFLGTSACQAISNNKGVGKTSLVYHLAWMYAELGVRVVAADLDPQANLTSMFLDEDRLERLWPDGKHPGTVFGAIQPLLEGTGDVMEPRVERIGDEVGLLVGDLAIGTIGDDPDIITFEGHVPNTYAKE